MEDKSEEFMKSFFALCKRYDVGLSFRLNVEGLYVEMDGYSGTFEDLYVSTLYKDIKEKYG